MPVRHQIARVGWALSPYRLVGGRVPRESGIILGAPHTSNWDFAAFLGVAWYERIPLKVLIKKYGAEGTHLDAQRVALDRLAQNRRRPTPPPAPARQPKAEEAAPEASAE